MENLAILDFGSNSTRLAIIKINADKTYTEVKRQKEITRLARGMGKQKVKYLQPKAIEQTLKAVADFKVEYEKYPNVTVKAIATAAVRCAKNSAEFLVAVKQLTGVNVEVLSGQAEAYYDYLGVINTLPLTDCLLCDMGGGSFEIALVINKKLYASISIPYGAVSLSEKFNAHDKISAKDLSALQAFIRAKFNELLWLKQTKNLPLVLLGGANRTVARCQLEKDNAPASEFMHGVTLTAKEFNAIYTSWLKMDLKQRKQQLGSEQDRADIIIGGLTPVIELICYCQVPNIIFSESGVREGIIYSILEK